MFHNIAAFVEMVVFMAISQVCIDLDTRTIHTQYLQSREWYWLNSSKCGSDRKLFDVCNDRGVYTMTERG